MYSAFATLAFGSALALFLYPHSVTGVLSSSRRDVIKRNTAMLPAYSFLLGLIALLGYMALASGVADMPQFAAGFKQYHADYAVPALFLYAFPSVVRRLRLRRHRHRRAGARRDHEHCRGEPVHAQHLQGVPPARLHRQAGSGARPSSSAWWSSSARSPSSSSCRPEVRHHAAAARRRVDPADVPLGHPGPVHQQAAPLGPGRGLGRGHGHRDLDGIDPRLQVDHLRRYTSARSPCPATPRCGA